MTDKKSPENQIVQHRDQTGAGVDRRRFVGLVGASLAAHWLAEPPTLGWSASAAPPAGTALIPGYLRASHLAVMDSSVLRDLSDPRLPPHDVLRRVIPADLPLEFISSTEIGKVPMEFDGGRARVHIHGVLPPSEFRLADGVGALHLEAAISIEGEGVPISHYVWGFDTSPVENISGPTGFDVPLGKGVALQLHTSFERAEFGAGPGHAGDGKGGVPLRRFSTLLTLEDRYGQPRLRPGVYCLPLNDKALSAFPLVANRDWLVPDDLPYVLFSVESLV